MLQPGSCNLRLGRASDPLPHSVPHVIAYRTDAPHFAEPDDTCVLRPLTKVNSLTLVNCIACQLQLPHTEPISVCHSGALLKERGSF